VIDAVGGPFGAADEADDAELDEFVELDELDPPPQAARTSAPNSA